MYVLGKFEIHVVALFYGLPLLLVGYCLRNGQKHLQGEQWNEGCDYICTCEDASTGKWKCTQRSEKNPSLLKQTNFVFLSEHL